MVKIWTKYFLITIFLLNIDLWAQRGMGFGGLAEERGRGGFRGGEGQHGSKFREQFQDDMFAKLNLSEDQKEKLKIIQANHKKNMFQIQSKRRDLDFELSELLTAKDFSIDNVNKKVAEINGNNLNWLQERVSLVKSIRNILTEKQIEEVNFRMFWGPRRRGY